MLTSAFFFSSRRRHTRSVSAFLLNRSSDLFVNVFSHIETNSHITGSFKRLTFSINRPQPRSEERFSRNAETELVCRLLLEKKKLTNRPTFIAGFPPAALRPYLGPSLIIQH